MVVGERGPTVGSTSVGARRRSRLRWAVALAGVVLTGLATALVGTGWAADALGSVLYTAAVFVGLVLLRPAARGWLLAAGAFAVATAVELAQLTAAPAALAEAWPPVRLLLGTSFDPRDVAAYALGAVVVGVLDALAGRVSARRAHPPHG